MTNADPQLMPALQTQSFSGAKDPTRSPYYVPPEKMTPLQRHCAFFDRDHDGLLMPWETFRGFRILGYNLLMSLLGTFLVHFFFSYWTLDSWIPDPFFSIIIRNVGRLKHGSDSEVYNHDGTIKRAGDDPVLVLLGTFDREGKGGLSLLDGWRLTQRCWEVMDIFGWFAAKLEWFFLWALAQRNGIVSWDDIRAQYDGSLFYAIEERRRATGEIS